MGQTPSTLPPASQPGSPLQLCLNKVFAGNVSEKVGYPQDFLFQPIDVKAYNTRVPVIPAAVTRPSTTAEISGVLACATASDVKVQAKSGGHSYANYGLGGEDNAVVVDMVNYQHFKMDTTTWQATIGSGTRLGDVTTKLHDAGGRAIAHGTCPDVGIGGHATIGGLGPLSRQWGAALDHVVEVEIVLANGTVTRANAQQNPDILFAVKGAAASFGVVTEFVVVTHPEPGEVVEYSYTVKLGKHADMWTTFKTWQTIVADPNLDRKLASQLILLPGTMIISGTYFGTEEEFSKLEFAKQLEADKNTDVAVATLDDWLGTVVNWSENAALKLISGIPSAFYSKSLTFNEKNLIPDDGIKSLFEFLDTDADTLLWFVIFDLEGGAVNDIAPGATAYAHRDALFYMQSYAIHLTEMTDKTMKWVQGVSDVITNSMPGATFGAYAGYVDPFLVDGPAQYWNTNLPKLQQIKTAIDPLDRFHNPQSVPVA